ncbi:alpha/beta fold hydrolase [Ruegeria arenilitoris]|uniref:alpha/beta fold hydrolase n=1 Tax=Ruegeria arenilitoris TaxID=1173585 RepID=UPI00346400F9
MLSGVSDLRLSDGRTLTFAQYRPTNGVAVVYSNGSGGSRLEWPGDEAMLHRIGVRFISVDRPGHGHSDPDPDRTLQDWPSDIAEPADHLRLDRFYVEGWSAGGAYRRS